MTIPCTINAPTHGAILPTHVLLLGYSSLVSRPCIRGYLVTLVSWSVCVLLVYSSPKELRRRVPSLSLTRAQELLWMNIQPSSCWIKIISLILCVAIHHPGHLIQFIVLHHCVFVC